jgi:hypothetical protein
VDEMPGFFRSNQPLRLPQPFGEIGGTSDGVMGIGCEDLDKLFLGYAPAGFGTDTLLVGGLVVGAGVGIAVAASNDNNSTTHHQVSP